VSYFVRTNYENDPAMPEGTEARTSEVVGAYASEESAIDAARQTKAQLIARRGSGAVATVQVIGEGDEVIWEERTEQ
jgi:hypothetical protein